MTPRPASPRLAISYARWSSEKQSAGDSARRQASMVSDYCTRHSLTLDTSRSMVASSVSAFKGKNIAAGSALAGFLDAVKAKQIPRDSVLLIESLDRLSRLPALDALDVLRRICASGVTVVTLEDHREYTEATLRTDSTSLFVALSVAIRAHEESRRKSERVRGAWKSRRDAALDSRKAIKGRIPAWLKWTENGYKVIEDKARVVRQVYAWATTEGLGADAIATRLNRAKIPTFGWAKHGWERSYVRLLLQSPHVVGDVPLSSGGEPAGVAEGLYPAIVERRVWLAVQERRSRPTRLPSGPRTVTNLWTGLAVCGECGSPLHHVSKGQRRKTQRTMAYLVCARARHGKGCALPYVDARAFEMMTVGMLAKHLDWQRVHDEGAKATRTAIETAEERAAALAGQVSHVESRVTNVLDAIESGSASHVGDAPTVLVNRLRTLEADASRLKREHADAVTALEHARASAQTVERDTRNVLDAFGQYLDNITDADTRTRLAQVLREVVQRVSVRCERGDKIKQVEVTFRLPGLPVLRFDLIEPRRRRA